MTIAEDGHTSISVMAGRLHPSPNSPDQCLYMGSGLYINITPETARQWITTLEPIAAKEESK